MKKCARTLMILTTLTITVCAHKASPLSKDRMKPKLQNVAALNNRQIQFTFSEAVDTTGLKPECFNITSKEGTLEILTLYPSLSAAEIIAITEFQSDIRYEVSGYVLDTAQNRGEFEKSFPGSSAPDTIVPWLVDYSKGAKRKEFILTFSEAMDTTFLEFYTLPKKTFAVTWQGIRTCRLAPDTLTDSLRYDTTYYLYINKGARDLSGNLIDTFITSITPDTAYKPLILKGGAQMNDTLVKSGLAVLERKNPIGIAVIEGGEFLFEVRDSLPFTVEVISGKYSGSARVAVDSTNTVILKPEEKDIDNLIN